MICDAIKKSECVLASSVKFMLRQYLLEEEGCPNICDNDGESLLMLSVRHSYDSEIVTMLLEAGADVEAKNKSGLTALSLACALGKYDMAKTLLGFGADIETKDEDLQTPLFHAVLLAESEGTTKMARLLLEHGANSLARNVNGDQPIDLAKRNKKVHSLLELRAVTTLEEFCKTTTGNQTAKQ